MNFFNIIFDAIGNEQTSLSKMWGSMILVCALVTGILHGIISIFGSWRLMRRSWKWVLFPIGLTIYSALNAFITLSPLVICIAESYRESEFHLSVYEFSLYCAVMVLTIVLFSCGRQTMILIM